jgi:hypothetical protein
MFALILGDFNMMTRRKAALAGIAVVATVMAGAPALGADKVVKIGMDLSLTGLILRARSASGTEL